MMLSDYATCYYISLITLIYFILKGSIPHVSPSQSREEAHFVHYVCSLNISVYERK